MQQWRVPRLAIAVVQDDQVERSLRCAGDGTLAATTTQRRMRCDLQSDSIFFICIGRLIAFLRLSLRACAR